MKNWTGERLETFVFSETTFEHLHRYALAIQLAVGKVVLDIASGEGYGSNLLSDVASNVIGVDVSEEVIENAKKKYRKANLDFVVGSADHIPIPDKSIDVVVSFETIEHHDKHDEMLFEIKRVLKDKGLMIMSSPNKLNYTDRSAYKNPFHVQELYENEFKALINKNFRMATFLHQQTFYGSLIFAEGRSEFFVEYKGNYDAITRQEGFTSYYIIAIASDLALPDVGSSLFKDSFAIKALIDGIKKSRSFRLGYLLLTPLRSLRKILK
ncbi:MAG: class I SAM-dependent methyltransferase [Bacteroidetes bacterium]|nr:class I SAM-dependent methyltransferase [Bacteroidota bacterium]